MEITVNGKRETIQPCSIAQFIETKGLKPGGVVVEHNRQIVRQPEWDAIQLQNDDTLELLNFVGGG